MTAYIIHNEDRLSRMHNIIKQAYQQGFKYQIVPAVMKENPIEGCMAAHKNIVRMAKKAGLNSVLIMEDDVAFTAPGAFRHFLENIPKAFSIYTAGVYGQACSYNSIDGTVKRISGTHCYIVHNSFYDKYLALPDTVYTDEAIGNVVRCHLCYPMAALQIPGHSDILKEEVDYNNVKWVAYPLFKNNIENFQKQMK